MRLARWNVNSLRARVDASVVVACLLVACGSPSASGVPSADVTAAPVATDGEPDVAGLTWLAVRSLEEDDLLIGVELALVRGDGSVAWQERMPVNTRAPASGIGVLTGPAARSGRFAVGTHVDGETVIRIVDRDGAVREQRVAGTVLSGVIAPDGSELYLVVSARELTIERLELDGDGAQSTVAAMPPVRQPELMAGIDLLRMTPDGRRLVIEVCTGLGTCWWRIVDLESGAETAMRPDGAGPMVDLSNDTLLATATSCQAGPCPFVLIDLGTGAVQPWDPNRHSAALGILEDGGTVLISDGSGVGNGSGPIVVTDPTTLQERMIHDGTEPDGSLGIARAGQREWAPPGWMVAAPLGANIGEMGGPTLIRLRDGFVLRLPAPAAP